MTCFQVIALVGVVVLKEVVSHAIFILPVVALVGVVVLKEVVGFAIISVNVLCVLV